MQIEMEMVFAILIQKFIKMIRILRYFGYVYKHYDMFHCLMYNMIGFKVMHVMMMTTMMEFWIQATTANL